MNSQETSLKDAFSSAVSKVYISENLSDNCNERLFLEEIKSKQPISLEVQSETESSLEGTINFPFNIKFTLKNFGLENKTDFNFEVKIKKIAVALEDGAFTVALEKSNMEFSFRTTPLPYFMSLVKQLGAFSVGVETLFNALERNFQEKLFAEIATQITQNLQHAKVNFLLKFKF